MRIDLRITIDNGNCHITENFSLPHELEKFHEFTDGVDDYEVIHSDIDAIGEYESIEGIIALSETRESLIMQWYYQDNNIENKDYELDLHNAILDFLEEF